MSLLLLKGLLGSRLGDVVAGDDRLPGCGSGLLGVQLVRVATIELPCLIYPLSNTLWMYPSTEKSSGRHSRLEHME